VIVDPHASYIVDEKNIHYKCGWSPMEGMQIPAKITHTFVNGNLVYENGMFNESIKGMRLQFERD
jgi:dihydroorotase